MQLPGGHLSHVLSAGCRAFGSSLLDTLFPPRCVGCGDFETFLCADCRTQMEVLEPGVCCRCGRPLTDCEPEECPDCGDWEPAFAAVRSAFLHTGAARTLVAGLKYGGQRALAGVMAENAAPAFSALVKEVPAPRAITWVPAHPRAERRRGYNQAELLARGLADIHGGLKVVGGLRKVRETSHQRGLGRRERRLNLKDSFRVDSWKCKVVDAGAVIVVDDVCTTGATAHEVAVPLRERTGLAPYVFTFSRAADLSMGKGA